MVRARLIVGAAVVLGALALALIRWTLEQWLLYETSAAMKAGANMADVVAALQGTDPRAVRELREFQRIVDAEFPRPSPRG